jgi:hypothetical protein
MDRWEQYFVPDVQSQGSAFLLAQRVWLASDSSSGAASFYPNLRICGLLWRMGLLHRG